MTAPATLPINIDDEKVRRRFDSYVDRRGYDECWLWNGPRVRSGHGQVWDGKRNVAAHRMALALSGVEIDGKLACHKCANPGCVNPHHLYAGTFQTNIDDAIAAGNKYGRPAAKGEQNHCAKLTQERVAEIKRRYKPRDPVNGSRAIAREFGVSQAAISKILRGLTWQH